MLNFAPDTWPLFWTIIGAGAAVTALLCLAVATFSPSWFSRHHRRQAPATRQLAPAGRGGGPRMAGDHSLKPAA
jgi:hypothetical protein